MNNIGIKCNDPNKSSSPIKQCEDKAEVADTKTISGSDSKVKNSSVWNPAMTPCSPNVKNTESESEVSADKSDDYYTLIRSQPDGIAMTTPPFTEANTPPPYMKWAEKLRNLLEDVEGVRLFECYLKAEDCQDSLHFWLACQGLKTKPAENETEIAQIIRVIYRKFLRSSNKLTITNETRQRIQTQISNKDCCLDQHVFDIAQAEVESSINNTTYPNFLRSDIYLQYVQRMQNEGSDSPKCVEGSASSSSSSSGRGSRIGYLQTVDENEELQMEHQTPSSLPLTLHHLNITQRKRAGYAESVQGTTGHYMNPDGHSVGNPYHALYAPCIPVSAQDSELQSLSSDAHTDDTMSQTDSSVDGIPIFNSKKYLRHQYHAMKTNAKQNLEMGNSFIPRQLRVSKSIITPKDPKVLASLLIQKLELLKQAQEREEKSNERFNNLHGVEENVTNMQGDPRTSAYPLSALPTGILKLNISEDSSQAILDDHVNRVFHDCSDQSHNSSSWTPSIQSPENRRGNLPATSFAGNTSHHKHSHHHVSSKTRLSKSPSELVNHSLRSNYVDSPLDVLSIERERRNKDYQGHSGSRKMSSSYDDSGISTIHEPLVPNPTNVNSCERVMNWMLGNEKYSCSHHPDSEKDSSTRHRRSSHSSASAGSPVPNRQSRGKKPVMYNSSRSGSLERRSLGNTWPTPTHPFIHDTSMPILPPPNTTTQLEEACRRLEDNAKSRLNRKSVAAIKDKTVHVEKGRKLCHGSEHSEENGNGIRKSKKVPSTATVNPNSENSYTVVGYYFCDEKVPYRTKLLGKNVTLRQFKTLITKKGNYRYFFQRRSDEFGSEVVNEEVTDDNAVLPLWEGKIIARVELIEES